MNTTKCINHELLWCFVSWSIWSVGSYHNKKETKKIGEHIRDLRIKHEFNIEDISAMTGFSRSTITAVENGAETNTSHLIEIAKAIGIHPKQLFDLEFEIKPRYKQSQKRKDQKRLTAKIRTLIISGYFREGVVVNDLRTYLSENKRIKVSAGQLSVVLLRLVKEGYLKSVKSGRKNLYRALKN